jgi:hypothetical protein
MKYLLISFLVFNFLGCSSFSPTTSNSSSQSYNNSQTSNVSSSNGEVQIETALKWILDENNQKDIPQATIDEALNEINIQPLYSWKWFITEALYYGVDVRFPTGKQPLKIGDIDKNNVAWLTLFNEKNQQLGWGDKIKLVYLIIKLPKGNGMDGLNGPNDDLAIMTYAELIKLDQSGFKEKPILDVKIREAMISDLMKNHGWNRETATMVVDTLSGNY